MCLRNQKKNSRKFSKVEKGRENGRPLRDKVFPTTACGPENSWRRSLQFGTFRLIAEIGIFVFGPDRNEKPFYGLFFFQNFPFSTFYFLFARVILARVRASVERRFAAKKPKNDVCKSFFCKRKTSSTEFETKAIRAALTIYQNSLRSLQCYQILKSQIRLTKFQNVPGGWIDNSNVVSEI